MQSVAVVTDSIACLPRKLVEKYQIGIVPIRLYFQGREYRDWVDISPTEAYELFLKDPESFTTSPASPGHYLEVFHEASKRAKNILCITLSSRLSTGYNMAEVAKNQAGTELPGVSIDVLDSQTVTAAEGFVALAAALAAADGKSLAEVSKVAEEIKGKATFIILLDTIKYVYRTGRIPKIAAQAASVLNIKPILTISGGLVRFMTAVRNREQGINRLLKSMKGKVGESPVRVAVMHAYDEKGAGVLKERISSEFNCVELWVTEFSPVMGYACGVGTIGMAYYKE